MNPDLVMQLNMPPLCLDFASQIGIGIEMHDVYIDSAKIYLIVWLMCCMGY